MHEIDQPQTNDSTITNIKLERMTNSYPVDIARKIPVKLLFRQHERTKILP